MPRKLSRYLAWKGDLLRVQLSVSAMYCPILGSERLWVIQAVKPERVSQYFVRSMS